jgi:hypothetical protein
VNRPYLLAAARRGFTFYLADPSARLTTTPNAFGVRVNRPYLQEKGATSEFCLLCGRRAGCNAPFVFAADTAASTGEILGELELLGTNFYR